MLVLNVFTIVTLLHDNWKQFWYTVKEMCEAHISGLRAAKREYMCVKRNGKRLEGCCCLP